MTHSLSFAAADSPPAMCRSATLAMLVSSTSMNVGTVTTMARIHGFSAPRPTPAPAPVDAARLLIRRGPRRRPSVARRRVGRPAGWGRVRAGGRLLEETTGMGAGRGFLEIDIGDDRQPDEEGRVLGVAFDQVDPHGQALDDL